MEEQEESAEMSAEEQAYSESGGEEAPEQEKDDGGQAEAETEANKAETVLDKEDKKPPQDFVPHQAFHAERERRKALESEVAGFREKWARVDERLKALSEGSQKQDELPNPEEDIFGATKWVIGKIQENESRSVEQSRQAEADRQQQAERAELISSYQADALRFRAETPDFGEAYNYLVLDYDKQLQDEGVTSPAERMQKIHEREISIAQLAMNAGISPSKFIYDTALSRGYKKEAEDGKSNGSEKFDTIEKGQNAAKSLSNAGGGPGGEMTGEALLALSEEEFAAALDKMSESQIKQIFGA